MTSLTTLPERIDVGALSFTVVSRPNRKTIEVTVERDASLSVKVPDDRGVDEVRAFIDAKRAWVYRRLAEKDALLGPTVTKDFVDGEGFLYLGRSYRLKVMKPVGSRAAELPDLRLVRGRFELRRDRVDDGVTVMRSWYQVAGTKWLRRRLPRWLERFGGLGPVNVQVDQLGYRWGSARPGGRVNLHWASLQLPPRLLDYVLVHEMAHLGEPNHTHEFWAQVERVLPDAPLLRDDLSQVGASIWLGEDA